MALNYLTAQETEFLAGKKVLLKLKDIKSSTEEEVEFDAEIIGYSNEESIEVYIDGSVINNGSSNSPAGWGAVFIFPNTDETIELKEYIPAPSTNNRAEMSALLGALIEAQYRGIKTLEFYSDSQYVIKSMNGEYRKKKNLDLWLLINRASQGLNCTYTWVRGHADNKYNILADKLANEGRTEEKLP